MKKVFFIILVVAIFFILVGGFYSYKWFSFSAIERGCFKEINYSRHAPGGCEYCKAKPAFYWYEWPSVSGQEDSREYVSCLIKNGLIK
ncbi:MAG: hypothetical protein Q7R99_03865 [bacterium]|nr:hypothetical protein [bacterium]